MFLRIFLPVVLMAGHGTCVTDTHFSRKFNCQMAGSGSIDTRTTRSLIGCSKTCSEHSDCRSFFYEPSSREYQRHSSLYASSNTIPAPITGTTAVYFEKEDDSTSTTSTSMTTTTTTTTSTTSTTTPMVASMTSSTGVPCVPPPLECPATNETIFIQYCDQTFSFRLYFDITRNFPDAKAECESQGGQLIEILTVEKMNFARQLVQCPDYNSSSFWVDGEYNGTTLRFEASNGDPLPLDQGTYFVADKPGTNAVDRCIRIDPTRNHLLDDSTCSTNLFYMICEKP